jgi:hypothetical protein
MSDWISVEDGLPSNFKEVLTYDVETAVCEIACYHEGRWLQDIAGPCWNRCVTQHETDASHWMPLPKPPRK